MIARSRRLIAAASLLGACTTADTSAETETATAPPVVILTATDSTYAAPDTLREGWTTFRLINQGTHPHAAQLVRLEEGRTLEEFVEAYEHAWRTVGPRPSWAKRVGGPGVAAPHATTNATMYLEPGSYGWYCHMWEDGVPHVFRNTGMEHAFVVVARGDDAPNTTPPEATAEILLHDYSFQPSTPLTAGRHVFRVVNHGAEPHEVALVKLGSGVTIGDVLAWEQDMESPPPDFESTGGVNALATGAETYFEVELEPGDYVLLCFVTAPDGRSHVQHGMIRQFSVE
jgi:hypothetical protein